MNDPKILTMSELFRGGPEELYFRVMQNRSMHGFDLFFDIERASEKKYLQIVDFTVREVDAYEEDATSLKLSKSAAKCLMGDLWRLGVRPEEDHSTSEITALQAHLKDMRAIVSNKLKVTL